MLVAVDEDGSGSLDKDELRQLVARLGKRLTDQQLQDAMDEMDPDQSGDVDYDEFEVWWQETAKQKDSVLGSLLGVRSLLLAPGCLVLAPCSLPLAPCSLRLFGVSRSMELVSSSRLHLCCRFALH
jgi:hypothetical protein